MAAQLGTFLDPEAIILQSDATSSEAVIRMLAAKLEARGYVKPGFADAVIARERELPTGLDMEAGHNVAVPHTDPHHVVRAGVAVATLETPVDFANMEDPDESVPVSIVFLLAINDKDQQIETLQAIIATIQDARKVALLTAARNLDNLKAALS
ncbi:PTS sugar transporter subunit IIA [Paraburkholderia sp. J41]|uniref:PTS sugar transporter subunit IIA n=1 Tax=Paraburkholderia sp. J41 TaxID=2805433 RepID=UPI002AC33C7F|nr:PTS sugar transporter subunit IIA [Paraburkholderia sp. J41]